MGWISNRGIHEHEADCYGVTKKDVSGKGGNVNKIVGRIRKDRVLNFLEKNSVFVFTYINGPEVGLPHWKEPTNNFYGQMVQFRPNTVYDKPPVKAELLIQSRKDAVGKMGRNDRSTCKTDKGQKFPTVQNVLSMFTGTAFIRAEFNSEESEEPEIIKVGPLDHLLEQGENVGFRIAKEKERPQTIYWELKKAKDPMFFWQRGGLVSCDIKIIDKMLWSTFNELAK